MKKKQILKVCSVTLLSTCLFGSFMASCGSSVKGLPVVEKSTALFDDFTYTGEDDFYAFNPLPDGGYFYNPILPGWYSDPSICTNGEGDYFLVTSTFTFYPGVPLFHSRDLVNWKQVGHILDRPSQLVNMKGQGVNGGIFAPAISYNPKNKTYYMITMLVQVISLSRHKTHLALGRNLSCYPKLEELILLSFLMKMDGRTLSITMKRLEINPNTTVIVPSVYRSLIRKRIKP